MAENLVKWPSKRGPITKIMHPEVYKGDNISLVVGKWYDFHEFGCHLLMWTAPDGIKRARMRSL